MGVGSALPARITFTRRAPGGSGAKRTVLGTTVPTVSEKFTFDTRGALLFLEDVNERPYRVDRMLTQPFRDDDATYALGRRVEHYDMPAIRIVGNLVGQLVRFAQLPAGLDRSLVSVEVGHAMRAHGQMAPERPRLLGGQRAREEGIEEFGELTAGHGDRSSRQSPSSVRSACLARCRRILTAFLVMPRCAPASSVDRPSMSRSTTTSRKADSTFGLVF